MKRYLEIVLDVAGVIAAAIIVAGLTYTGLAMADIGNPHPLPPNNSVITGMIKAGQITPALMYETGSYYLKTITATTTTADTFTANTHANLPASVSINGTGYSFPSSGGNTNDVLTEDGGGNLSWALPNTTALFTSVTSATTTTVTTPKAVYISSSQIYSLSFDNHAAGEGTMGSTGFSSSFTVSTANHTGVIYSMNLGLNLPSNVAVKMNGVSMTKLGEYDSGNTTVGNLYVFFADATTTGTTHFVVSYTASGNVNAAYYMDSYKGVASSQTGSTASANATSVSITTATNNSWVGGIVDCYGAAPGVTGFTNGTLRDAESLYMNSGYGDTNTYKSPAGSITVGGTCSGQAGNAVLAFELQPYAQPYYGFDETSAAASGTSAGFFGFIESSPTQGSSQSVYTNGLVTGFTGLTPGDVYYLGNNSGSISTTAGTVSHKVGVAISSTHLIVDNGF